MSNGIMGLLKSPTTSSDHWWISPYGHVYAFQSEQSARKLAELAAEHFSARDFQVTADDPRSTSATSAPCKYFPRLTVTHRKKKLSGVVIVNGQYQPSLLVMNNEGVPTGVLFTDPLVALTGQTIDAELLQVLQSTTPPVAASAKATKNKTTPKRGTKGQGTITVPEPLHSA